MKERLDFVLTKGEDLSWSELRQICSNLRMSNQVDTSSDFILFMLRLSMSIVLVKENGNIVAHACLKPPYNNQQSLSSVLLRSHTASEIGYVFVSQKHRNKGISKRMLKILIDNNPKPFILSTKNQVMVKCITSLKGEILFDKKKSSIIYYIIR